MGKIITQCPHCEQKMNVDEEFVGKKIRCPNCKNTFPIEEYTGQTTSSKPHDTADEDAAVQKRNAPFSTSAQNDDEFDEIRDEFQEFETKDDAKAQSFIASQYVTYDQPTLSVFKNIVPKNMKIVGEYNLGCCGWIAPECTKLLITENEVFVSSSRRYILGIFPGGKKIASYPIEFHQMRAGILKYSSLFAAFLFLIFGLAVGLLGWFLLKEFAGIFAVTDPIYSLKTMFKFTETYTYLVLLKSYWYLFVPFAVTLIWVLLFWKSVYKTILFKVPISRFKRKVAQEYIRKINEQALRIEK